MTWPLSITLPLTTLCSEGCELPGWLGVYWRRGDCLICAPVPLNLIYRALIGAWWRLKVPWREPLETVYLRAFHDGYVAGGTHERELGVGRRQGAGVFKLHPGAGKP